MNRHDRDTQRELHFHWDERVAALMAEGCSRAEAERRARLELDPESEIDYCRDVQPGHWLDDLARDLRYALRLWRRRPAFAAAALATMALGIASTTIMVALVGNVILKPLAFADPGRLLSVQEQTAGPPNATAIAEGWGNIWAVTYPNYRDLASASRILALGAWRNNGGIVSTPGAPAYVDADEVTASLFPVLGVTPIAGRDFTATEDRPGGSPVAVISAALARERFGGDAAAVGHQLTYSGTIYTVVGVMPPGFDLTGYTTPDAADIYLPLRRDPSPGLRNRGAHMLAAAARLQPGVTLAQAQREVAVISSRLAAMYPATWQTPSRRSFLVRPWRADVGSTASMLWLLLAAAGLTLLIAASNIASLLLARAFQRIPELAMRAALGASRSRLVRQCLAESLLLGAGGGLLGIVLAGAGLRPFLAFWPGGLPRAAGIALDWRVLAVAGLLTLSASLLFGLAPAWRVRLLEPEAGLRSNTRTQTGGGRRLQSMFVAAQVALALVLLVSAGTLGHALLRLSSLNLGVNPQRAITARIALPAATLANPARTRAAWRAVLARVRALPSVESAAVGDTVPLREGNNTDTYWFPPVRPPDSQLPTALITCVSPGYFQTMGIPLVAGRVIDARDRANAPPVAVIDDVLARRAFGTRDPIGRQIQMPGLSQMTIVGVVQHIRYWGAADDASPVRDQIYYAFSQIPDTLVPRWSELMSLSVRTRVPSAGVLPELRPAVADAGNGAAMYEVRTLRQLAHGSLDQQRFLLLLFALFSALAMALAAIGVYGVEAQLAVRRMPELGVRAALGASRGRLLWMVLRQSLGVVAVGIVLGGIAALGAGRALRGLVDGVGGAPPLAFGLAAITLFAAAALASLPPARRASLADPVETLRQN